MVSKPNPRPRKTALERTVPAKVKAAVELLLGGADLRAAALGAKLQNANRLRDQLKLPHVRCYISERRAAEIEELCSGNFRALKAVRDEGENAMAKVAAVRLAEQMRVDLDAPGRQLGQALPSLGLCIVIQSPGGSEVEVVSPPAQGKLIEGEAEEPERLPVFNPRD
jgi:hypothetical protein